MITVHDANMIIPSDRQQKDGPGRPQYGWSANEARRPVRATDSRQDTSLGQARHTDTRA